VKCKIFAIVTPFYPNDLWLCLKPPRKALQGRTACEKNGHTKVCVNKGHDRLARSKALRGGFGLSRVYSYKLEFS
jgi:hypothetical protein